MTEVHVVLGAGGPTGFECVRRLIQTTKGPVRAVVRDPAKYEAQFKEAAHAAGGNATSRLQVVAGDVTDPDSLKAALKDAAGVIFAASGRGFWSAKPVDYQGVVNMIDAARASGGVKHLVLVSSMLTDPANRFHPVRILLNNIRWSLMDNKFASEQQLRQSGIPFTIVRPGGLNNAPAGQQQLQAEVDAKKESLMGSISRADVAAVCVEALSNPAAKDKTLSIVGRKGSTLEAGQTLTDEVKRLFGTL